MIWILEKALDPCDHDTTCPSTSAIRVRNEKLMLNVGHYNFFKSDRPNMVLTLSKPVLRVQSYQREFRPNCHKRSCTADKNLFTGGWLFIWRLALKSRASEGKNNWWDGWSNIGLKIQEFQGCVWQIWALIM